LIRYNRNRHFLVTQPEDDSTAPLDGPTVVKPAAALLIPINSPTNTNTDRLAVREPLWREHQFERFRSQKTGLQ
jgi:hypothetical protein